MILHSVRNPTQALWAVAYGHPNYLVSDDGRIYSVSRLDSLGRKRGGRFLRPSRRGGQNGRSDYLCVRIDGQMVSIHRLMLESFVRPAESGRELACHRNDVATDNRLSNLAWGTYKDNAADRSANGGYRKNAECLNRHKYTPENTWYTSEGYQQCRTCHSERERKRKACKQ